MYVLILYTFEPEFKTAIKSSLTTETSTTKKLVSSMLHYITGSSPDSDNNKNLLLFIYLII